MNRCASWIEISASRLTANYRLLEEAAGPESEVMAVIKANAYGHDAGLCAPVLLDAGARWFGVTSALEGVRIRQALAESRSIIAAESIGAAESKPDADILLLSGVLSHDIDDVLKHALTPVVWTEEQVSWLGGTGVRPVHVEVDTAMGRGGVTPGAELARLLDRLATARVPLGGVMTHFASSEIAHSALTAVQEERFAQAIAQVRERGLRPAWVHAGNTSSVDNPARPAPWLAELAASVGAQAMVRSGLALYGHCLAIDGDAPPRIASRLKPVMTWKAPVLSVRTLAAGQTAGYNATFAAPAAMRVALLPVGYADGLRRELSSNNLPGQERAGGWCILRGRRAPILGRVSMNLIVADVSAIPNASTGDEAILLGEGVSAEDHARLAGTIPYEILCGVRASLRRLTP